MKKFKIPVCWEMYGYIEVEADNLEDAMDKIKDDSTPLPEGAYVEGSFQVDWDAIGYDDFTEDPRGE